MIDSPPAGVWTGIASLPPSAHVDTRGLAAALGVCTKSIERATRRGELPAPFRLGGRNVWMVSTILQHFEQLQKQALEKQQRHAKTLAHAN